MNYGADGRILWWLEYGQAQLGARSRPILHSSQREFAGFLTQVELTNRGELGDMHFHECKANV